MFYSMKDAKRFGIRAYGQDPDGILKMEVLKKPNVGGWTMYANPVDGILVNKMAPVKKDSFFPGELQAAYAILSSSMIA